MVAKGFNSEEAIENIKVKYEQRLQHLLASGDVPPTPGGPTERFEFWEKVLGTSYKLSFVSNESVLTTWEHYVGGREELKSRVKDVYGVKIDDVYDLPIPDVLQYIETHG